MTSDTTHKASCSSKVSKAWLYWVNLTYLVIGILTAVIAGMITSDKRLFGDIIEFGGFGALGGIVATGVFLILLAVLGFVATARQNSCMLFFYIVLLSLLCFVQIAISLGALSFPVSKSEEFVGEQWCNLTGGNKTAIMNYNECYYFSEGFDGCTTSTAPNLCPHTCRTDACTPTEQVPPDAPECGYCFQKFEAAASHVLNVGGGIGLIFSLCMAFGVWAAVHLRRERKSRPQNYQEFL
eukprot:m.353943 g.353943  ORF g.353943 m.353943 type:complete len:239 (+) comp16869_c0_seq1:208-924(+)